MLLSCLNICWFYCNKHITFVIRRKVKSWGRPLRCGTVPLASAERQPGADHRHASRSQPARLPDHVLPHLFSLERQPGSCFGSAGSGGSYGSGTGGAHGRSLAPGWVVAVSTCCTPVPPSSGSEQVQGSVGGPYLGVQWTVPRELGPLLELPVTLLPSLKTRERPCRSPRALVPEAPGQLLAAVTCPATWVLS